MKLWRYMLRPMLPCLLLGLAVAGCSGKDKPTDPDAAIVAGADFVFRMDVRGMKQSPIYAELDQGGDGAGSPLETHEQRRLRLKIEKATGFSEDDIDDVLISADLDSVEKGGKPGSLEGMQNVQAALALRLARPVKIEQLEAGLKAGTAGRGRVKIGRDTIDGVTVLKTEQKATGMPPVYAAAPRDGTVLFFTMNEKSMSAVLQRVRKRKLKSVPRSLAKAERALPGECQARLTLVLPEEARKQLRRQTSGKKSPGLMSGFTEPFQDIKSLAMGIHMATELEMALAGDLGDASHAEKAATVIETMIIPMIGGALAQSAGENALPVAEMMRVAASGSMLRVDLKVPASALKQAVSASLPGMAGLGRGGGTSAPRVTGADPVTLVGEKLEDLRISFGDPKGTLETQGGVIWFYDDIEITSSDGKTVSSAQRVASQY